MSKMLGKMKESGELKAIEDKYVFKKPVVVEPVVVEETEEGLGSEGSEGSEGEEVKENTNLRTEYDDEGNKLFEQEFEGEVFLPKRDEFMIEHNIFPRDYE